MTVTCSPAHLRASKGRNAMRHAFLAGALVAGAAAPLAPAHAAPRDASGDVVRTWNDAALDTVRRAGASDAQAARLYAMVHAAMYDAVNGVAPAARRHEAALVAPEPGTNGDARIAAATAAHDVLSALYPADASRYDAQLAADLAEPSPPGAAKHGSDWGSHVASAVVAARATDGSSPTVSQPGSTAVGHFTAAFSGVQFRGLAPFAIADSTAYFGAPPPALDSAEYAAAFDHVRIEGSATPADAAKSATFAFWALGRNTTQPPGAWLQVADTVSADRQLSLHDTARLFALTSMAMADTVAPTYWTKFTYHTWRPFTAIRRAGEDGNALTVADTTWTQRADNIGTSPEYWSGHSSFSAAGARVLAGFLCDDSVPFTLATDSGGGAVRSYDSFSEAAAEAGVSRVVGGLHFEFSNSSGLAAGRAVADEVLATSLRPLRGTSTC